jgi:cytochrome bd-type quinol oxidase subunit 2
MWSRSVADPARAAADRRGTRQPAGRAAYQLQPELHRSFWDLLQPYGLFTGIILVLICQLHGGTFQCLKITGHMRERSVLLARRVAPSPAPPSWPSSSGPT